jgi:hypothetical protein
MESPANKELYLRRYVCCLVDVLGQQDELRELDRDEDFYGNESKESGKNFMEGVTRSHSTVDEIRKTMIACVDQWHPTVDDSEHIEADRRARVSDAIRHQVSIQTFSDTVLAYSSLVSQDTNVPMTQIWPIVCAVMYCQMRALANGRAIRGGIDLGWGFEFGTGDLYGPVLSRVHAMESKQADYPRVIVGERLLRFVDHVAESGYEGEFSTLNKSMAENIRRAFVRDADGHFILDFAGSAHFDWIKGHQWPASEMFKRAKSFVDQERARFVVAGNAKLALRYSKLSMYLSACRQYWTKPEEP